MICPHAPTPAPALIWWPGWLAITPEALGAKKEEVLSHRGERALGAPLSTQSKRAVEVTSSGLVLQPRGILRVTGGVTCQDHTASHCESLSGTLASDLHNSTGLEISRHLGQGATRSH